MILNVSIAYPSYQVYCQSIVFSIDIKYFKDFDIIKKLLA